MIVLVKAKEIKTGDFILGFRPNFRSDSPIKVVGIRDRGLSSPFNYIEFDIEYPNGDFQKDIAFYPDAMLQRWS